MTLLRRGTGAAALLAAVLTLAACTGGGAAPTTGATGTAGPPKASPQATVVDGNASPDPDTAQPGAPTCENLLSPKLDASLRKQGWTPKKNPLFAGNTKVVNGLLCVWGDYSAASDHVQMYGYGSVSATEAKDMQRDLEAQGWQRKEIDGSLYFTQDKDMVTHPDENGYGITYQFGDGWVRYADTKQGLLLIQWPRR